MAERAEGRRLPDDPEAWSPGDYGKVNGVWHACTPDGHLGDLGGHEVTEHEDGTITVSPSILVTAHDGEWHGYLERGIWREV